jgi:superfamily II DNA/RNA helicase
MAFMPCAPVLLKARTPRCHPALCRTTYLPGPPHRSPAAAPSFQTPCAIFKVKLRKKRPTESRETATDPDTSGGQPHRRDRKATTDHSTGTHDKDDKDTAQGITGPSVVAEPSAPRRIVHQVRSLVSSGQHVRIVGASCGGRVGAVLRGARERAVARTLVLAPTRESTARAAAEARVAYPNARVIRDGGNGLIDSDLNPVRSAKRATHSIVVGTPRAVEWSFSKHEDGPAWIASVELLVMYDVQLLRDSGCIKQLRKLVRAVLANKPQVIVIFNSPDPEALNMLAPAILPKQQVVLWVEDTPRIVRDITAIPSAYTVVHPQVGGGMSRLLQFLIDEAMKSAEGPCKVLVFFPTGRITQMYAGFCASLGLNVHEAHSNKTARHRARVMASFREQDRCVLFSSDMAARGSELDSVTHVIHVGLPRDRAVYKQRLSIGGANVSNLVVLQEYEVQTFLSSDLCESSEHVLRTIDVDAITSADGVSAPGLATDASRFVNVVDKSVTNAAYFSWLAYYLAKSAMLGWSKEDLVRESATWVRMECGLSKPPLFQRATAKHLHLLGVDGVVIESPKEQAPKRIVRRQGKRNSKGRARAAAEQARSRANAFAKKAKSSERYNTP